MSSAYRCPACIRARENSIAVLRNGRCERSRLCSFGEIQAQYAAARESGDADTIEILQAEAREIAKAKAHAVAVSEGDGDEAEYTRISDMRRHSPRFMRRRG
jgi:hypothetical protein